MIDELDITNYLKEIENTYQTGIATKQKYSSKLYKLLHTVDTLAEIINDPKQIACGSPDYIILKDSRADCYIKIKDLHQNLSNPINNKQFELYQAALPNIIFTNYLNFKFVRNQKTVLEVELAKLQEQNIIALEQNFSCFIVQIKDFFTYQTNSFDAEVNLVQIMANKTRLMKQVIENSLQQPITTLKTDQTDSTKTNNEASLRNQYLVFKQIFLPKLEETEFADIYAQTITYELFSARLNSNHINFDRKLAVELIPKRNHFIRTFFDLLIGSKIDERIIWVVDELLNFFQQLKKQDLELFFKKRKFEKDPIIHFYETFLQFYDSKKKKEIGVYYTPEPIVNFMVETVDQLLKTELEIDAGLADYSTIEINNKQIHLVQILDPATGTGTFLTEIIRKIYKSFRNQKGSWDNHVTEHLIPRLHGFELMMPVYAMAHLRIYFLLKELSETKIKNDLPKLGIYLTNSIGDLPIQTGTSLESWLLKESEEAISITKKYPIMVVLGNPPYNFNANKKGFFINDLINKYTKDPNGQKLEVPSFKPIYDDYIKFIALAQNYIEKREEGIVAYICPSGFLDNITFRGMRYSLLTTFTNIYILNLHGDSKKTPTLNSERNNNVFDVQHGVAIVFFIKTKILQQQKAQRSKFARVRYANLFGTREYKYDVLWNNHFQTIHWKEITPKANNYLLIPWDDSKQKKYNKGFRITDLFIKYSTGIDTGKDEFCIHFNKENLKQTIDTFLALDNNSAKQQFNLTTSSRNIDNTRNDLANNNLNLVKINYRAFDQRYTYYTGNCNGFHNKPNDEIMANFLAKKNIGLLICKQSKKNDFTHIFITDCIAVASCISNETNSRCYLFPLYIFCPEQKLLYDIEKKHNFNLEIVTKIIDSINLEFITKEQKTERNQVTPLDLLDYVYGILYSPHYRKKYNEFLCQDFPKIAYPKGQAEFFELVQLGSELRKLHLLKSSYSQKLITEYQKVGNNKVENIISEKSFILNSAQTTMGVVYINRTQYFSKISKKVWQFTIGNYQPAQKWLKSRQGKKLTLEEIRLYKEILASINRSLEITENITPTLID